MKPVNFASIRRVFRDGGWHCRYECMLKLGRHPNISPGIQDLVDMGDLVRSEKKRKHPKHNRLVWFYRLA